MEAIILQVLNGLDKGSAYALIALGLTLIFGTLGVVNFAHGALFMIGAFCAVTLSRILTLSRTVVDETQTDFLGNPLEVQVPYVYDWFGQATGDAIIDWAVPLSILFAIPVMMLIGVIMERGLIKHFYNRPHADQILVTFGLAIVLQEIIKFYYGANPIPTPAPDAFRGSLDFGAMMGFDPNVVIYPYWRIIYFAFAAVIIGAVFAFLQFTTFGMVVRAGMADRETVQPAGHQHRPPLHHHVRPRRRGGGPCGRDVHADQLAELPHGDGFPRAQLRGRRRRRHGLAAGRRAGRVPAGHPGKLRLDATKCSRSCPASTRSSSTLSPSSSC
jgi:branched-chain amino acid transport system permease protein